MAPFHLQLAAGWFIRSRSEEVRALAVSGLTKNVPPRVRRLSFVRVCGWGGG